MYYTENGKSKSGIDLVTIRFLVTLLMQLKAFIVTFQVEKGCQSLIQMLVIQFTCSVVYDVQPCL